MALPVLNTVLGLPGSKVLKFMHSLGRSLPTLQRYSSAMVHSSTTVITCVCVPLEIIQEREPWE